MENTPTILQNANEFQALLEIYKQLKPKKVLEIGVKYGGTLWYWIHYAPAGATVVAVDDCKQINSKELSATWAENKNLIFLKGDSHSWGIIDAVHAHGPYDFVFIDGDHTYEGVKKDWENFGNASVVAFHDIVPHNAEWDQGPSELWQEIKDFHTTKEFVNDWHGEFGGIGVVYPKAKFVL